MRYELAPLQRGMLFHALSAPGSTMYVEQYRLDLEGDVDPAAFHAAWRAVCARHAALRTAIDPRQPAQVVLSTVDPPLAVDDWRELPEPERTARAAAERERGFDLASAPLFRLRLARTGDRTWRLLWTYHHLVLDGWSAGLVLSDVAAAYAGDPAGAEPPAYRDFVAATTALDAERARDYWSGVLAGFTEPTPLGITGTGTDTGTGPGHDPAPPERIEHRLPAELTARLGRFAGEHGLTVETLLVGAWAMVLGRYADTDDVVFGVTSTGRSAPLPGLDRTVGLLINTLPARVRLEWDSPVVPWLERLEAERTRAWELELTPLDRVQAWSEVPAGRRLFDSILVVEDFPVDPARLRFGGAQVSGWVSVQQTNYPLTLLVFPRERLELVALFDPALIDPRLIRPLLTHLEAALDGLTLGTVDGIFPESAPEVASPGAFSGKMPIDRISEWARREPGRVAVCCGGERLSYRELVDRAAGLAGRLTPGTLVGIYLPRGVDLVVAVLAVAWAGAGAVPIDRRHPAARARDILADAAVAAVLTDHSGAHELGDAGPPAIQPDEPVPGGGAWTEERRERSDQSDEGRQRRQSPGPARAEASACIYVIYTSGSTGAPKGVVVEHRQLARLFDATNHWFGFGPDDVWTLFHSIAFDFSVWELWGALVHGGRLVIVPDELTRDPAAFRRLLLDEGVTVLNQTPSAFGGLVQADLAASAGPSPYRLRAVILGGERLEVTALRPWLDRYGDASPRLVNMYGITETTVHVTYHPITRADLTAGVPSPIGEPIPDLAVRLLDSRGRPVPVGVPGEIYVGGAGVARGYLNRPDLTAQRFVERDGTRWYRSGDRARWLPGGGLEFLGRLDDQVKIRGYRIEPGEIESVLNGHPGVRTSVVAAVEVATGGHRQLVAYVVADPDPALSIPDLRAWLAERLPDHLVPARFVRLDRLPLTPNGKVDRAALPAARPERPGAGRTAPRTDTERTLAEVWAEVLGLPEPSTADNFFALGGDSILAIQVAARAGRRGVAITPALLFTHQTIAELAEVAEAAGGTAVEADQGEVTGDVPATPVWAWFGGLALPHPGWWNLPALLVADRPVERDLLARALTALVAHHDLLRLRVHAGRAWIPPAAECDPVPVDPEPRASGGERRHGGPAFDLARGPLLRAAVVEPDRVLLVAHHLVVDAVSWRILLEDLDTAYRQVAAGEPVRLPAKTTDAIRWARGLTELAASAATAVAARWWLDRLPPRVPALPADGTAGNPDVEGDRQTVEVVLDELATARLLADANRAYRTRPDELMLAALARAVSAWTGDSGLLVDVEGHGRDIAVPGVDVSRTVGWFTTFTPRWLDLSTVDPEDPAATVKAVKEQLRAVPDRAAFGLARWLRDDDLSRRLAELPQAPISFNYLGRIDAGAPAGAWFALAPEPAGEERHPANPRPYPIDVVAGIHNGRLRAFVSYSGRRHSPAAMRRLADAFADGLRAIVDHCATPGIGGPTPSDFPLAQVDQPRLDRLAADRGDIEDLYPLTPLQRGLLYHTLANPDSGVYFEQFSLRLDGPLDGAAFERAWRALLDRHAVLRASVAWRGLTVPHLVVHARADLPLTRHDWAGLDPAAQAVRLDDLLGRDRAEGFDLTRAPLTRLHLVRLADRRWHLVWSHHHILLDGWSVGLLIQEILDGYEAIRADRFTPVPPPRPYRDYIGYLASLDLSGAWAHWRRVLSGVTGPTPLRADHPAGTARNQRTGRRDADYARLHRRLPVDRSDAVREFARAHRLTLDTLLHGAWALALAHRAGTDDVIFGVTSAGRPAELPGVEEMVGLFINTLPARVRVSRDQPVASWLSGLQRDQAEARRFEHTPLDQIRGWTSVPPGLPLFDSGRALENYPMDGSRFRTGSVTIGEIRTFEQADYALSFVVVPDEALLLNVWYDALRFESETGEHLMRAVEALVLGLAADPDRTVGEVLAEVPPAPAPSTVDTGAGVAELLRALPLVRDAAVVSTPDGHRLTAYVVPDLAAADLDGDLAERHVADWRELYDETFAATSPADPAFNTLGWNSSYTGEPIETGAMVEWREVTLDRIRALRPRRVLELGCGTGLLLFGLLDACEAYVGTDFSAACLAHVRDHLATLAPEVRAKVTLREQAADDTDGLEPGGFDVVVVNSVAQYFPGAAYLDRVLDAAVRLAAPGGAVFAGDLRHHGLREAFHVSVQLRRAVDLLPVAELRGRVERALSAERELLVDPAYLVRFATARPEIGAVEVAPKRGRYDTELTRYRYDAVLSLGPVSEPDRVAWFDWHRDVLTGSEIGWLLEHADTDAVGVTGVPNARVAADVEAARLLFHGTTGTAGELRLAAGKAAGGVDPEELYRLGESAGWTVTVSWAVGDPDGSVNALFRRGAAATTGTAATGVGALHGAGLPDGPLVNAPLRGRLAEAVERQAFQALQRHAPAARLLVVDELPRTPDGRVDEAALPVLSTVDGSGVAGAVPPRTADELRLARIWEQALRSGPVDVRTSFFDLGGDSLLAIRVIDEAARVFGRDVPLATLLREPTIEGMAAALRAEPRPWSPLVEFTVGEGTPFFCVHPAGGTVLCYADLARLVAPLPFYGLQARGVDGDDPPYDDLPAMAARYLTDVRARQPSGPYLLGGWSMGGLVAYEMARRLYAAGERVALLALIETATPDVLESLPGDAASPSGDAAVLAAAEWARAVPEGFDPDRARRLAAVYATHLDAVRRYRPEPYGGRVCLVRAAATTTGHRWGDLLTGEWETVEVPGDHDSIVWPPHVERLAEVLRDRLGAAPP